MKVRSVILVLALIIAATFTSSAQNAQNATKEKLYISLENLEKDNLAIVDLATFKEIKRLTVGSHDVVQCAKAKPGLDTKGTLRPKSVKEISRVCGSR